jgi:Flp pilus assembly protein TadG
MKRLFQSIRGSAAVEFALTFPIMVVVTLMIFDLGRALFVYTTVNNMAAEGSRYAAVHGERSSVTKTADEIETYITNLGAGLEASSLTVTVAYSPNTTTTGAEVTVTIDYALDFFLSGVFENVTGGAISDLTLTGVSTMTVL